MRRFKDILLAASPGHLGPVTVRAAARLAVDNDAQLTVIDVVPPVPRWRRTTDVEGQVVDVEAMLLHDREQRLRHLVASTGVASEAKAIVMTGEPFIEVIRQVLTQGHDLVMLGDPARNEGFPPRPDSGVMHLLRKCPVPVWVMRPSRARKLRILALIDPDPEDPVRDGLNDLVLQLATSLTRLEDANLHVAHAWSLAGEATLRSSSYVMLPDAEVDVMVKTAEAAHREQVGIRAERHGVADLGGTVHLVRGNPGEVLPRLAAKLKIGLIVMGTVARTGLSGLIIGNTAETILRSVECSVLAVKPEGFRTPVKVGRRRS